MLSKAVHDAVNEQIKHELYSAYLYLAMSAHLQASNLLGAASWMRQQSQEELGHATKFFDYLNERGARVTLQGIDQPPQEFGSLQQVFQQALDHERQVTQLIHGIYDVATQEKDYATQATLQWFITEQVEEERSAEDVLNQLKMVGDHPAGLFMLDRQLGMRAGAS